MSRTRIPSSGRKLIGRWYGGRGESGLGEARGPVSRGSAPESLCADVLDGLERVGMPAYLVDRHGRIRWLNAAFLSLLGDARGRLLSSLAAPDHVQRSREPSLTPRQHEVLTLLADGTSTEEIAAALGLSDETVRNHIRQLLRRLGVHSPLAAGAHPRRP